MFKFWKEVKADIDNREEDLLSNQKNFIVLIEMCFLLIYYGAS
ncbi:hypothetical protein CLV91_2861 [Maribacter vaceletii]|uniref:Uncharacterized protein n=1 Tax=Maribacter vaceletii TaxID=1206816 RepID=A0A495DTW0_9FLAO|nr:hypothetical protein CLV91_2861 [Maribacter vaceletii]